jgi:hypothetical protein
MGGKTKRPGYKGKWERGKIKEMERGINYGRELDPK